MMKIMNGASGDDFSQGVHASVVKVFVGRASAAGSRILLFASSDFVVLVAGSFHLIHNSCGGTLSGCQRELADDLQHPSNSFVVAQISSTSFPSQLSIDLLSPSQLTPPKSED